jgi:hypothetical protein
LRRRRGPRPERRSSSTNQKGATRGAPDPRPLVLQDPECSSHQLPCGPADGERLRRIPTPPASAALPLLPVPEITARPLHKDIRCTRGGPGGGRPKRQGDSLLQPGSSRGRGAGWGVMPSRRHLRRPSQRPDQGRMMLIVRHRTAASTRSTAGQPTKCPTLTTDHKQARSVRIITDSRLHLPQRTIADLH